MTTNNESQCPVCEGEGAGRYGPGACSFCDGGGTVATDELEAIAAAVLWLQRRERGEIPRASYRLNEERDR